MRFPIEGHRFLGFFPPYRRLEVLDHPFQIPRGPLPSRGWALLWNLRPGDVSAGIRSVRARPPGVALFMILPPAAELENREIHLRLMATCRPHSVLPHVEEFDPEDLISILRRPPSQLGVEVTDYIHWRGVELDLDTRRLLRKTLELSGELRTVGGLARALYMSRRALGRRFMSRGLPVPSHWLHFGRVLRGSMRLQQARGNLFNIGCELGYPDGFAFSNQMKRLTSLRPSFMRECFGWEWIVESWLFQEARTGGLSPKLVRSLYPAEPETSGRRAALVAESGSGRSKSRLRVAEDYHGRSMKGPFRDPR